MRAVTRKHQGPIHGETKNLKVKSGSWLGEEGKKKKKKKKSFSLVGSCEVSVHIPQYILEE